MSRTSGVLPDQLPWGVAGPGVGVCVVALYGPANARLGVSGGWLQLLQVARRRPVTEPWRLWRNGGLVVGAVVAAGLGRGFVVHGYGDLSAHLSSYLLAPLLLLVGLLIGYGARWARGCTSGHGISGCSVGSPESLVATAVLFGVAVVVTLRVPVSVLQMTGRTRSA